MKAFNNFSKDQQGMTGLETAIILIAFVTVAAVFGYAVLSAGLFSAERGKETIYSGLNEAQSNLELSGSVMAMADNATPTQVGKIKFTVKNAIAGNPIDMTPNGVDPKGIDQTGKNKCIISLATHDDYFNNVAWTFAPIGHDNSNNLLETGEQFEITVDVSGVNVCMNDSGRILSLGALVCGPNLGDLLFGGGYSRVGPTLQANDTFSLQVKPSVGASITIQRTLPPAIGPVMDLDLMTSFGGGHSAQASDNASGGGGGTPSLVCTEVQAFYFIGPNLDDLELFLNNTGTGSAHISPSGVTVAIDGGTATVPNWVVTGLTANPFAPGANCNIVFDSPVVPLYHTVTVTITPDGGPALIVTRAVPGSLPQGITVLP
ncbi:MAG: hypothetical protein ABSA18_15360 [Dehalococcoidia bacterium]|jgi:flagellin FlaB